MGMHNNNNLDVLLLLPPISSSSRYGKFAKGGSKAPPMGICIISSVLMKLGLKVKIIDSEIEKLDLQKTVNKILYYSPKYLCLSATTITINSAHRIVKEIKARDFNGKIILGGPHLTSTPKKTFEKFSFFELGIIGEAEETIKELIINLEDSKPISSIRGIIFRKNEKIIITPERDLIKNLNKLPMPSWYLLPNIAKYYKPPLFSFQNTPSTSIVTSRGCPSSCLFCDRTVFGNRFRYYDYKYVICMIDFLTHNYNIKDVLFDDDVFTLSKIRIKKFCEKMMHKKNKVSWSCNTRVDMVDQSLLLKMRKGGCWQIAYGIESGSQKILDFLKKKITVQQIKNALTWTSKAKIRTKGFLMIGNPLENKESLNNTLKLILTSDLDDMQLTFFTPLPGTEIYENIKEHGSLNNNWSQMSMWNPVFIPKDVSEEELIKFQKKAIMKFYFRPKTIFNYFKLFLEHPKNFYKIITGTFLVLRILIKK